MPNTESNTLRYKSGRIPVIALDYSSRQLAQKRELLVDYKNAKLYVVSAEDRTVIYDLTSNIIKAFKESGGASDFTIEIEGLGTYKLGDIINQLYTSKIDLIEDKEFQYNAPTVSFDNKSLAIYDRQASMLNFNRANDRTVPMKKDDALVWMPFDLENLENRLLKLENTSVPDIEEWESFRTRLAAVEATDELYKDLPNMKANISINAAGIKDLSDRVNALDINTVKDNITTLTNTVNTHNGKIKTDEANLELLTKKVNDDDAILQLLEERANTNLATLTDLLSRTTKLENINANDRLSTVENDIVNINSQLASVASSENISNIDERLHALEDKYPVDISSLTTDVTALKTKTATHDSAIPELQEKVATLEQNVTSLSGIDIDQINNNIDQKVNSIKQTVDSYTQTSASLQTLVDQLKTSVDAIPVYTAGDGIKISSANEISLNRDLSKNLGNITPTLPPTVTFDPYAEERKAITKVSVADSSFIIGGEYHAPYYGDSISVEDNITTVGISSENSVIIAGESNTIKGRNSVIINGSESYTDSEYSTIIGRGKLTQNSANAVIINGGSGDNKITNGYGSIIIGTEGATITGSNNSTILGKGEIIGGNNGLIIGHDGAAIHSSGSYNTILTQTVSYIGPEYTFSQNKVYDKKDVKINADYSDFADITLASLANNCTNNCILGSDYSKASGANNKSIADNGSVVAGSFNTSLGTYYGINVGQYSNVLIGGTSPKSIGKNASNSVSIGGGLISNNWSIAIGQCSSATAEKSIALGYQAASSEKYTISFGHKENDIADIVFTKSDDGSIGTKNILFTEEFYNRLVNAADGISAHDVATVGQTIALSAGDNITVTEDGTNDIGQKKFKISASFTETPLTIDKIESVVTADTTRVNNLEYVSDSTHSINNINVTQYGFTKDIFANKQFLYLDTTDNKIKLLKFSEKTIN